MSSTPSDELPTVYQANLDAATFDALLCDLRALEDGVEVSVKHGERAYVDEMERWTLDQACAALASGTIRAMQLRYRHQGAAWTDTVFRADPGFRVVRMRAP